MNVMAGEAVVRLVAASRYLIAVLSGSARADRIRLPARGSGAVMGSRAARMAGRPGSRTKYRRWRRHGAVGAASAALALSAGLVSVAPAVAAPTTGQVAAAAQALAPPGLFAWGSEDYGELGNGVTSPPGPQGYEADAPQAVTLPATVSQLSASGNDGAALLANGRVATWGDNAWGQLGDGTTTGRSTPFVVADLTGIIQVANGGSHMLALDSSGRVWAWGSNPSGELGLGTTSSVHGSHPSPVVVPGLTGVIQIAAGGGTSFALRSDGTVWAWGRNTWGQLGDGTLDNRDVPSQVPGVAGIKKIFAGTADAYAIRADGSVLAWGDNNSGLIGNGTVLGSPTLPGQSLA
jgi:hypothetical protein